MLISLPQVTLVFLSTFCHVEVEVRCDGRVVPLRSNLIVHQGHIGEPASGLFIINQGPGFHQGKLPAIVGPISQHLKL